MNSAKEGPRSRQEHAAPNTEHQHGSGPPITIQAPANNTQILQALETIRVEPDQVIELRALEVKASYGRPMTVAGWFDDITKLASHAIELERRGAVGIYVTMNPTNPQLLGRACNRVVEHPRATTADHDIVRRTWLPFDIDPVRPAYVSATPGQIEAARQRALQVVEWLEREIKLRPDILAFSGNGFHALYRIDLPNTEASTAHVKKLVETTANKFDDEVVKIDRTVFNASRIWKLYGTRACKGDEVPRLGMTHRYSTLLNSLEEVQPC
jgi:hypothetical protein